MTDFERYSSNFIQLYTDEVPQGLSGIFHGAMPGFSVLDLGCGDGALLIGLHNKGYLKNAGRIVGVDLSSQRINRLKHNFAFELICADACNVVQLEDKTFDYIFSSQVIEHVLDDKAFLREIHRLIKDSGILFISSIVKRKYGWYVHRCNKKWALDPTHLREYSSEQEFITLIESARFKVVNLRMTSYKFTPMDFIIRRLYFPIFRHETTNSFFLRHKLLSKFRLLRIPVFGYYIIDLVAKTSSRPK